MRRGRDWRLSYFKVASAEGATAPETLRQRDRGVIGLWKVGVLTKGIAPPKMKAALDLN